jgi:hypothetical protein
MGDRRHMQQKISGSTEGRVHRHGIVNGGIGDDIAGLQTAGMQVGQCARRVDRELAPHRFPGRRER